MYSPTNESYTGCLTLGLVVVPVAGLGVALLTDVPDRVAGAFVLAGLIACVLGIRRDCIWNECACAAESEMRQWSRTLRDYAADHQGRYPTGDQLASLLAAEPLPDCRYNRPTPGSPSDFVVLSRRVMPNLVLDLQLNGAVRRCRSRAPIDLPS